MQLALSAFIQALGFLLSLNQFTKPALGPNANLGRVHQRDAARSRQDMQALEKVPGDSKPLILIKRFRP
jgi:hypothetical protein